MLRNHGLARVHIKKDDRILYICHMHVENKEGVLDE